MTRQPRAKTPKLLPSLMLPMAQAADLAIGKALLHGSVQMIAAPRGEVGFVAAVTLGAVPAIAAAWRSMCRSAGLTLSLTGVFCHGVPQVKFTDIGGQLRQCELADLLLVVDDMSSGTPVRRAALIQAKMAGKAQRVYLSDTSSVKQLDLYQNWHVFDFVDAAYGLNQVDFNRGRRPEDSGTYGVIDRHWKNRPIRPPKWTQHAADPKPFDTGGKPSLGMFLAEMVRGPRAGFGRPATPSLRTDWSRTVEELLRVTYNRSFRHKQTLGRAQAPRGVTAMAFLNFGTGADELSALWAASGGQPPYDDIEIVDFGDRPDGISTVHIRIDPLSPSG